VADALAYRDDEEISLTIEKGLLKRADAFAKKHGKSRAKLVAEGLRAMLGSAA
jgi:metal-responsive CopG/Arc/MetJ family transcriptional regulator